MSRRGGKEGLQNTDRAVKEEEQGQHKIQRTRDFGGKGHSESRRGYLQRNI